MAFAILFLLGLPTLAASVAAEAYGGALRTDAYRQKEESFSARTERVEKLASVEREALAAQQKVIDELVSRESTLLKQQVALEKEQVEMSEQLGNLRGSSLYRLDERLQAEPGLAGTIVSGIIWVVFAIISGWIYGYVFTYEYPALKSPLEEPPVPSFRNGLCTGFACDPDWRICLCSFLCMHARWADTVSSLKVSFMEFWYALILFSVTICAPFAAATYGATYVVWLFLVVKARQRIREVYQLPHGDVSTYLSDCFTWLCCPWCAAMQEALEVEFVEPNAGKLLMETIPGTAPSSPRQQSPR